MAPSPGYKPHKEKKQGLLSFLPILLKQHVFNYQYRPSDTLVTLINIVGSYHLQSIIDSYVPDQMRSTLGAISIGWSSFISSSRFCPMRRNISTCSGATLCPSMWFCPTSSVFYLPMSFATRRTGEIVSRFTDANSIIDALASTILSIFLDVSTILIISLVCFHKIWRSFSLVYLRFLSIQWLSLPLWSRLKRWIGIPWKLMRFCLLASIHRGHQRCETIKSLTSESSLSKDW